MGWDLFRAKKGKKAEEQEAEVLEALVDEMTVGILGVIEHEFQSIDPKLTDAELETHSDVFFPKSIVYSGNPKRKEIEALVKHKVKDALEWLKLKKVKYQDRDFIPVILSRMEKSYLQADLGAMMVRSLFLEEKVHVTFFPWEERDNLTRLDALPWHDEEKIETFKEKFYDKIDPKTLNEEEIQHLEKDLSSKLMNTIKYLDFSMVLDEALKNIEYGVKAHEEVVALQSSYTGKSL